MFAIKQEINNATSLFEIESITVGYPVQINLNRRSRLLKS